MDNKETRELCQTISIVFANSYDSIDRSISGSVLRPVQYGKPNVTMIRFFTITIVPCCMHKIHQKTAKNSPNYSSCLFITRVVGFSTRAHHQRGFDDETTWGNPAVALAGVQISTGGLNFLAKNG